MQTLGTPHAPSLLLFAPHLLAPKLPAMFRLLFLLLLIVLANHAPAQDRAFADKSIEVGGVKRRYVEIVPRDRGGALPLVVLLHGRGGGPGQVLLNTGFGQLAREQGFIVAAPAALGEPPAWNSKFRDTGSRADDIAFLSALLDALQADHRIDPDRIYIAGHSSGAMMSYTAAAELGDRIAAIAPVAGTIGIMGADGARHQIAHPKHPVSVLAIHGKKDELVPFAGGGLANFLPVEEAVLFWAKANACAPAPSVETVDEGIVRRRWTGRRNGTEVQLVVLENAGHEWPGGRRLLRGNSTEASATGEIWKFFEAHPRQRPAVADEPMVAADQPAMQPADAMMQADPMAPAAEPSTDVAFRKAPSLLAPDGTGQSAAASVADLEKSWDAGSEAAPPAKRPARPEGKKPGKQSDRKPEAGGPMRQAIESLNLTPAQQKEVRAILAKHRGDSDRKALRAEIDKVLTKEQRAELKKKLAKKK